MASLVLVVDDDPANLLVLSDFLSAQSLSIAVATDGEMALEHVSRVVPDLVLLDVLMPGLSGFDVCRRLKENPATKEIPIIFMTALSDMPNRMRGFEAGAVDYVTKPFEREELLARVKTQLSLRATTKALSDCNRDLLEAQARVVKLEKEATERQMAGGFAHEMRNALTGTKMLLGRLFYEGDGKPRASICVENSRILQQVYLLAKPHLPVDARAGLAALLKQMNANEEQVDGLLQEAGKAIDRALVTTHLILNYSRLGQERPGTDPVRLRALVESILSEMAEDFADQRISVEVAIGPGCVILGKEAHFYSILKNLVLNAKDAILEKDGPGDRKIHITFAEEQGRRVLRVRDTGAGIPEEHRPRIFDPFFSTKPVTGTGLGLGVVRKLVSLYEGVIEIESEVGRGTRVTIALPVAARPPL